MTADTKTALLDSAETIARARGFDGFSYADLADDVGIRKASIHYHFPTKATLSAALMDRYATAIAAACADIKATNATAAGQLQGVISLYRDALKDGQSLCLCVSLTISHQSLSAEVNAQIGKFRAMMVEWLEEVFTLAQSDTSISGVTHPTLEARACLALLEGAHLAARAEESLTVFDSAVAVLKARC